MAWTVRSPEGSLNFATIADIARAYRTGLVAPEDEVLEPGTNTWRRAETLAALRGMEHPGNRRRDAKRWYPIAFVLVMALGALYLMAIGQWMFSLALAVALTLYLMRYTRRTLTPRREYLRA